MLDIKRLATYAVIFPIAFLASISPATAGSQEFKLSTGNGLLGACTFESDNQAEVEYHFGSCVGFIKGVTNAYLATETWQKLPVSICPREGMDNGQLRDIVVKVLRLVPEARDQGSVGVVVAAMKNAFPCSKN